MGVTRGAEVVVGMLGIPECSQYYTGLGRGFPGKAVYCAQVGVAS